MPFDEAVVYTSQPREDLVGAVTERLAVGDVGWIVFFSPSIAKQIIPSLLLQRSTVRIAAIGGTTASSISTLNATVSAVAESPNPQSLVASILKADK